jgi:hypothetical protein
LGCVELQISLEMHCASPRSGWMLFVDGEQAAPDARQTPRVPLWMTHSSPEAQSPFDVQPSTQRPFKSLPSTRQAWMP